MREQTGAQILMDAKKAVNQVDWECAYRVLLDRFDERGIEIAMLRMELEQWTKRGFSCRTDADLPKLRAEEIGK